MSRQRLRRGCSTRRRSNCCCPAAAPSIPKTSSGKLRRSAAREAFEQGRLALRPLPPWRQFVQLAAASLGPLLRRWRRVFGEFAYAAWWWSIVAVFGAVLWPSVLLLAPARMAMGADVPCRPARLPPDGHPPGRDGRLAAPAARRSSSSTTRAIWTGWFWRRRSWANTPSSRRTSSRAQFVAGQFLRALGALFVERADPEGGVEDTRKATLAAEAGRALVFFPEGGFTRAPGLRAFRLGAFVIAVRQQLPIVPVVLRGTRSILRGSEWFPRHDSVSLLIGEPIAPEEVPTSLQPSGCVTRSVRRSWRIAANPTSRRREAVCKVAGHGLDHAQ